MNYQPIVKPAADRMPVRPNLIDYAAARGRPDIAIEAAPGPPPAATGAGVVESMAAPVR